MKQKLTYNPSHNTWKILSLIIILFISIKSFAQVTLPLNNEIIRRLEPEILKHDPCFFTSLKPYDQWRIRKMVNVDSLLDFDEGKKRTSWFGRKFFEESFVQIDSADFSIRIDPVFNFSYGKEYGNSQKLIGNTRGAMIRCRLGQNIGIESTFYENQAFFPKIWDQYITIYHLAPGQGRAKRYNKTGWDYAYTEGSITWRPKGIFMAQLGRGKNFVGDGYRSLLLSDVSTNYPFLLFSFSWKKFQYTRIISLLQNLDYKIIGSDIQEFPQKVANFHLINTYIVKNVQVSLFEGIILKNPDSRGKFSLNYKVINPIPYIDIIGRNNTESETMNSIAGINICWHITPLLHVYNQWCFDDPFHKKFDGKTGISEYGYQLGIKYYNAFHVRNLYMQTELNKIQPFTYSQNDSTISYSHFDQPLAHPLGANFYEITGIGNYRFKRLFLEYTVTLAKYGASTNLNNAGNNILRSPVRTSDTFLQGIKTDLITHQARIAWYLNPAINSSISAGIYWQSQKSPIANVSTKVIYISFSTNLRNLYYDF